MTATEDGGRRDGANPRVSFVIPCYNGLRYLDECLQSISDLPLQSYEAVVVDDGSTESIREAVATYAPHVRYIRQQHQGLPAARNTGVRNTTGDYIRFVDCDDYLLSPDALLRQIDQLDRHPNVGLGYSKALVVDTASQPFGVREPHFTRQSYVRDGWDELPYLLVNNYITASSTIVRRSALEQVGLFCVDLVTAEDWDCWLRIAQIASVGYLAEAAVAYRVHEQGMLAQGQLTRRLDVHRTILGSAFANTAVTQRYGHLRRSAYGHLYQRAAMKAYRNGNGKLTRYYALKAVMFRRLSQSARDVGYCLWLMAKSLIPVDARPSMRRVKRRYRTEWVGTRVLGRRT